jgi:hypothetical protein
VAFDCSPNIFARLACARQLFERYAKWNRQDFEMAIVCRSGFCYKLIQRSFRGSYRSFGRLGRTVNIGYQRRGRQLRLRNRNLVTPGSSLSDLLLQAQRMLTEGIVDRWIAEQHGQQHCHKTGAQHGQQHCHVTGHFDDENDAGHRCTHHACEEGGHAHQSKCLGLDSKRWKYEAASPAEQQSRLGSQHE